MNNDLKRIADALERKTHYFWHHLFFTYKRKRKSQSNPNVWVVSIYCKVCNYHKMYLKLNGIKG